MKILIVEDEASAVRGLQKKLGDCSYDVKIVGVLDSVRDAVDRLSQADTEIDLVFMDIHLKDGNCFTIFEQVEVTVPIIFCTAYEEYAIRAFEVNSLAYLLKPFTLEDVENALDKFQRFYERNEPIALKYQSLSEMIQNDLLNWEFRTRFLVKIGNKFHYVNVSDICYIYISNKTVYARTFEKKVSPLDHTIEELEQMLPPNKFFRINRQQMVSIDGIRDIINDYGRLTLTLQPFPDERFYVSRKRVEHFKAWLNR